MKLLVVLSAALAVCVAAPGYLGGIAGVVPAADAVPAGLAGLTAQGVPVDTPAVQAARAAHLAAAASAGAGAGVIAPLGVVGVHAGPLADAIPAAVNGLTPLGTPIDTPSVQAARALNAAAHLNAKGLILG